MSTRFQIARPANLPAVAYLRGHSRRAFLEEADGVASLHIIDISTDARAHYHK
jgi:hypothetical protein